MNCTHWYPLPSKRLIRFVPDSEHTRQIVFLLVTDEEMGLNPDAGARKWSKETRAITTFAIKFTWMEGESSETRMPAGFNAQGSVLSMHRPSTVYSSQ